MSVQSADEGTPRLGKKPDERSSLEHSLPTITVRAPLPPIHRRSGRRRSYYAIMSTEGEIAYPKYRPLGYLQQSRLIERAQSGDADAIQAVWMANARLAYTVANRCRAPQRVMADVIQAGQIGIHRAIELFEISRLNDFSTYAYHWIRSKMERERQRASFACRVPAHLFAPYGKFRRAVSDAPSRAAWFDARAAWLERAPKEYEALLRLHRLARPAPLEAAISEAAAEDSPLDTLIERDRVGRVERCLLQLTRRERAVIFARYGFHGRGGSTLQSVAEQMGVTRERVRQIQVRAEGRLRKFLIAAGFSESNPNGAGSAPEPSGEEPRDSHAHLNQTIATS